MAKLSEKQKRFIDYYIETLNASEAARRGEEIEEQVVTVGGRQGSTGRLAVGGY